MTQTDDFRAQERFISRQARLLNNKASAMEDAGRPLEALEFRRAAAKLRPSDSKIRENLAGLCLQSGLYDETITECRALIKLSPNSIAARDMMSIAYMQKGDTDKALVANAELIRLSPTDPRAHYRRGVLCQHLGNWKAAMESLLLSLELAIPDTIEEQEAEEAVDGLDRHQVRQIVLLSAEDKLFRLRLARDPETALEEKGYFLSPQATAFVQQVASGAVQAQIYFGQDGVYTPASPRFHLYN